MTNTDNKTVYFPGLNSLRFFAAALVVVQHIELEKSSLSLPNIFSFPGIHNMGGLGVTLFFVLSGFLITFLLLKEAEFGAIGIKNFYIRRMLRIWPLYYLIVFLGLFILPRFLGPGSSPTYHYSHTGTELLLFTLILPNISIASFGPHAIINHLWSVGVEEQFYLIWPVLIKYAKKMDFLVLLFIVIGLWFLRREVWIFDNGGFFQTFFYYFRIDCMAIGGLGACALHRNYRWILKVIFHRSTQVIIYTILVFCLLTGKALRFGNHPVYSIFFIVLIMNVAANPKTILRLENPVLRYLGKISYGLYMYHAMVILIVLKLLLLVLPGHSWFFNFLLYSLSIAGIIGIAAISYRFFESPFLNYKKDFSRVLSGDLVEKKVL